MNSTVDKTFKELCLVLFQVESMMKKDHFVVVIAE